MSERVILASGEKLRRGDRAGRPRRSAPEARSPEASGAERTAIERAVLVTKPTAWEELLVRFGTHGQARFWLERAGEDVDAIEAEHERYHTALGAVRRQIPGELRVQVLGRDLLPQYRFDASDVVVVLGPDGLVVNAAKYLAGQPVVAINPDPESIEGVLLPVEIDQASRAIARAVRHDAALRAISMAEAMTSDGQRLLAMNDLYIGARTHVSSRYTLDHGGRSERHSSSGVIVSTGAGSTGWLRSVIAGARGVAVACGGAVPLAPEDVRFAWDAEKLVFAVREPFPSVASGAEVVWGEVTRRAPLRLTSHMAEGGAIFGDGVEADFLPFRRGVSVTVGVSAQKTWLVTP
ncbi:hypothetical protein [Rubricoccus marinus]|uniref:hypothetical protein n=1 Tax=Rubricoccus marinus TaxID=716817 RepID=UPI001C52D7CC|nr:hypothetical protein [Rubricoccus marinus]